MQCDHELKIDCQISNLPVGITGYGVIHKLYGHWTWMGRDVSQMSLWFSKLRGWVKMSKNGSHGLWMTLMTDLASLTDLLTYASFTVC